MRRHEIMAETRMWVTTRMNWITFTSITETTRQDECCSSRFGCAVLVLRGDKGESLWPGLVKEQPVDLQRRRYVRVWSLHEKTSQLFC